MIISINPKKHLIKPSNNSWFKKQQQTFKPGIEENLFNLIMTPVYFKGHH